MWLMLQQEKPDDYVLATNETHTIKAFLDSAFERVNLDWKDYVKFDENFLRPAEVDLLIGDYSKAQKHLGWEPKTRMKALAELMVDADMDSVGKRSTGTPP
jgi:GDPmannose 4,6-dehydratase